MRYQHHERLRAYRSIETLIAQLRTRDHHLAIAARGIITTHDEHTPDGYPRGGDSTGRQSGISDPTGQAVEQRNVRADQAAEHAEDAIASVFEALRALIAADASASKALDPPQRMEPATMTAPAAVWCVSCARQWPGMKQAIAFEPRTLTSKRGRDDLCSWCLRQWEASNDDSAKRVLPDVRLVVWHAEHPGRYLTATIEKAVLAESLEDVRKRAPRRHQQSA